MACANRRYLAHHTEATKDLFALGGEHHRLLGRPTTTPYSMRAPAVATSWATRLLYTAEIYFATHQLGDTDLPLYVHLDDLRRHDVGNNMVQEHGDPRCSCATRRCPTPTPMITQDLGVGDTELDTGTPPVPR